LIKAEKGSPHQEGVFEININQVTLVQDPPSDDILFDKKFLFKILVEPGINVLDFKQKVLDKYNE